MDGVVINQMSLPDSDQRSPYNLGMTAVHEIGHWAGLFHTFENGCNDPGDEITDTAYEVVGYYRYAMKPQTQRSALLTRLREELD